MKSINVEAINLEMNQIIEERDWSQFHSIKNLSMALSVEVSELVEIFQWQSEEASNKLSENELLKEKVGEEIADIFLYLSRIALKSGIDIEAAVFDKIKKNREKYPVEKSKGNAKKYDSF